MGFTEIRFLARSTLICSVTIFALALAAAAAIFTFTSRQSVKQVANAELASTLRNERARLEEYVSGHVVFASRLQGSRFLQRHFSEPDNSVLESIAVGEIAKVRGALDVGTIFWANHTDKKLYRDGVYARDIDPESEGDRWYGMTFVAARAGVYLSVGVGSDSSRVLRVSAPVFHSNDNTPVGVIGVYLDLPSFIDGFFESYRKDADLYFFNALGEITLAVDARSVVRRKKLEDRFGYVGRELMAAARRLRPGETQTFSTPFGEAAVSLAPSLDWYALAIAPKAKSSESVDMALFLLILAAVLGVILAAFNVVISRVFKPLGDKLKTLEAALKVKDDFLAKMSHEIRTPMNAITGMAELALREEMPVAAQEHVYTIKQAGANLLSIINDILDLSKIESGNMKIVTAEYHFGTLVNDVVSIIRMRVMDSEVRFVVNTDSKIPSVLLGDEVRVRQILLNILSNAVKYTKAGFISLAINGKPIDDDTVMLCIEVADTGRGIKREDIGKLFGNFVQVDVVSNRGVEGTGLGLVITKNLTVAMGGKIGVVSEYGKGSTFTVTLPQKISSGDPAAVVDDPEKKSVVICEQRDIYANSIACTLDNLGVRCASAGSLPELLEKLKVRDYAFAFVESALYEDAKNLLSEIGSSAKIVLLTSFGNVAAEKDLGVIAMPAHSVPVANILNGVSDGFSYHTDENTVVKFNAPEARILVVDDIKTNLEVVKGLLTPYNMQVDVCLSGYDAIEAAGAKDYDLIFMDHMMPGMDGIETANRIRSMGGACAKVPIVALTANAVSGAKEMFLRNDFNAFLSKPVDIPQLNAVLEKWIPKKKQARVTKKTERLSTVPDVAIEGVDVKYGISRMGGDPDIYFGTLAVFADDCGKKIGEIKGCLESNDFEQLAMKVHALKGAAANIGAAALSEAAKEMEAAVKRQDMAFIQKHVAGLLAETESVLRAVNAAVGSRRGQQSGADMETVKAALGELIAAINDFDPDAINAAVGKLRRQRNACAPEIGAKIDAIVQNALTGEFDSAAALSASLTREV